MKRLSCVFGPPMPPPAVRDEENSPDAAGDSLDGQRCRRWPSARATRWSPPSGAGTGSRSGPNDALAFLIWGWYIGTPSHPQRQTGHQREENSAQSRQRFPPKKQQPCSRFGNRAALWLRTLILIQLQPGSSPVSCNRLHHPEGVAGGCIIRAGGCIDLSIRKGTHHGW